MGLILDSSVLIGTERRAETVSGLLRTIRETTGHTEVAISAISVIELGHGVWRADTPERAENCSAHFAMIPGLEIKPL